MSKEPFREINTFIRAGLLILLLVAVCLGQENSKASSLAVFEGTYVLKSGKKLVVTESNGNLMVEMPDGDLFRFSDLRVDPRVLDAEKKTTRLLNAVIAADRTAVRELLGASPGSMDDYVDGLFTVMKPALTIDRETLRFEIISTVFRDEDSEYGFEDGSWGWEVYTRFYGPDEPVIVRIVWDGVAGHNTHRGTGKSPPAATKLEFAPRQPSRSWIRVYDTKSKTTRRLREINRDERAKSIPARFVSYDIATHQTVSIRFRKPEPNQRMKLEIGPLGTEILRTAVRK